VTTCQFCRDGVSYPEKFMCNVLEQLNIEFDFHYHSSWTKSYYYDFAFDYNGSKYIIEMDGGLGHGHVGFKNTDVTKSIEVDKEKDNLAIANGYKIIRIDCYYKNNLNTRYEHIKNNVVKELFSIFDLSKVDFDKCNEYALDSLFKKVIDFYKNDSKYMSDIYKKFHLKESCVRIYLKHAMKIGIIPFEYLHEYDRFKDFPVPVIRSFKDGEVRNSKIIYCYDDSIAFDSVNTLSNFLNMAPTVVSNQLSKFNGYIFGKHYCYYNDLQNDFDFKPIKFPSKYKSFYQYTLDKTKLIKKYENRSCLPPEFNVSRIYDVCNGKRNSHKGFWWSDYNIFQQE
jgi:very-short-patch-repair endonuclease